MKFAYDNKALDDTAYAEISTRSGMRSGKVQACNRAEAVAARRRQKTVASAVAEADDLYAALVLARKRAFGPFRKGELDDKRKAKELSAFARAGFSFDIGKKVFEIRSTRPKKRWPRAAISNMAMRATGQADRGPPGYGPPVAPGRVQRRPGSEASPAP